MIRALLALLHLACLSAGLAGCHVPEPRPQPDGPRSTVRFDERIAWENHGSGDEALVFVHGWACDRSVWAKQMESLAPWRRIAIDLPGHGESDKSRIAYDVDVMVEALLAVLDDAHVVRAVLVGHSNGGVTVRRFLELHPERVAGLVLVDAPLKPFFESPEQGRKFVAPLRGSGWRAWAAKFVDTLLAPMHSAEDRKHVRAVMLGTSQHVLLSSFEGTLDPALWGEQPIRVPLMLVLAQQPAWEGDYRAFAEKLAPGLRWEMLTGVSHFLMLDEPGRFDELMRSFLIEGAPFARH